MNLMAYREDPEKQKSGTPIYVEDATFYVRRWGTPEAIKARRDLSNSLFGPLYKLAPTDDAILLAHWLAEYGVVGWEGVYDENSEKEIKYSKEMAREIFLDESMHLSLNEILFKDALKFENYLYDELEASVEEIKKP